MQYNNKSAIRTPLINDVLQLNKKLIAASIQMPNGKLKRIKKCNKFADESEQESLKVSDKEIKLTRNVRRPYFETTLKNGSILFALALRQLRDGKDTLKRSVEVVQDIQAQCFFVMQLGAMSTKLCAEIDALCDKIIEQMYAIQNSRNHEA